MRGIQLRLDDISGLAESSRNHGCGFIEFRRHESIVKLEWPEDVLEQWLYDHSCNDSFIRDYGELDLTRVEWKLEAVSTDIFMTVDTGPSDSGVIEECAKNHEHWIEVRDQGVHQGVRLVWDTHGTWKRWPIILDKSILTPGGLGLRLIEGRTRVGVLRGRRRSGEFVAARHLAWVGEARF